MIRLPDQWPFPAELPRVATPGQVAQLRHLDERAKGETKRRTQDERRARFQAKRAKGATA